MFLKVFKYDFKAVFLKLIPVFIILPILAVVVRLVNLINIDNPLTNLMIVGVNIIFVLGCVFAAIYTEVMCIIRYTKSLFKEQGYLTHTLPVNKHQLLLSQILVVFLMTLIVGLLIFISIIISYFTSSLFLAITMVFEELFGFILEIYPSQVISTIVNSIISSIQGILVIFLGIAMGHAHAKNKNLLSVVYCIALSWGVSMFTSLINSSITLAFIDNYELGYVILQVVSTIESLGIVVAAYFVTIYIMKKRLNLE